MFHKHANYSLPDVCHFFEYHVFVFLVSAFKHTPLFNWIHLFAKRTVHSTVKGKLAYLAMSITYVGLLLCR